MIEVIVLSVMAGIWILAATLSDLKTREIPNWASFSLIIFALGIRFFYSLFFQWQDFGFFIQGIIGLGIFFILGNLFYYARIFAGGDAKLLIALGPIIPFYNSLFMNLQLIALFFIIFLFSGMLYGIAYSFILCIKNFRNFKREFKKLLLKNKPIILLLILLGTGIITAGFFDSIFMFAGFFEILTVFMYFYAKAIDRCCMIKRISASKLSEGDWLYKDIKIKNKKIKSRWEGLTKKEIDFIKKHKRYVLIKEGIPYAPVFLVSFVLFTIFFFKGINLLLFFSFN